MSFQIEDGLNDGDLFENIMDYPHYTLLWQCPIYSMYAKKENDVVFIDDHHHGQNYSHK